MYDKHFITHKEKDAYYNKIYPLLHPMYDPKTRVYTKTIQDNDFEFKDDKLIYTKTKDLDLSRAHEIFPSFKFSEDKTIQEQISYYLNNNLVPGFSAESFDNFKKVNLFQHRAITDPATYDVDKTFNMVKDDLTIYNEKFFQEKEIDKQRKKNEKEKFAKQEEEKK